MDPFIITDTHFGHDKIVKYCGRPDDFESRIIRNVSHAIEAVGAPKLNDTKVLIHLGDFCIGRDSYWHNLFFSSIPSCKRWLIRGNHDRKSDSWYLAHGWDFVAETVTIERYGKKIVLSHKPLVDGTFDLNIHGHTHNKDGVRSLSARHILVKMEHHYQPVSLRKLADCNKTKKENRYEIQLRESGSYDSGNHRQKRGYNL